MKWYGVVFIACAMPLFGCGSDTTLFTPPGAGGAVSSAAQVSSSGQGGQGGGGGTTGCMPGEMQPCYSGPPNTEGVGICAAGVRQCTSQGIFGDCEGEVVPSAEDCMTPADEDCDGVAAPCFTGNHLWSKRFGGTDPQHAQQANAIAADGNSNVIVAGTFTGSIDIDGTIHTAPIQGSFVAKLDPTGTVLWSHGIVGSSSVYVEDVAASATGEVVLVGFFGGSVTFGTQTLQSAGEHDMFVAVLDAQGNDVWSKRYGGTGYEQANHVALDGSGNIIVAGYLGGSLAFEGLPIINAQPGYNAFVVKFSLSGTPLWAKQITSTTTFYVRDLAASGAGDAAIGGEFEGAFDAGSGAVPSAGAQDAFLVRISPTGTVLGAAAFGDASQQGIDGVAFDANSNVAVTGRFYGAIDFGGGALSPSGLFVARLDPSGAHLTSARFGNNLSTLGRSRVALDAFQHPVLFGNYYDGTVDLGGGDLPKFGDYDIYFGKLDPALAHVWSKGFGDSTSQDAARVATDAQGNALLVGWFQGTIDFGGGPLTATSGNVDAFVAKFAP